MVFLTSGRPKLIPAARLGVNGRWGFPGSGSSRLSWTLTFTAAPGPSPGLCPRPPPLACPFPPRPRARNRKSRGWGAWVKNWKKNKTLFLHHVNIMDEMTNTNRTSIRWTITWNSPGWARGWGLAAAVPIEPMQCKKNTSIWPNIRIVIKTIKKTTVDIWDSHRTKKGVYTCNYKMNNRSFTDKIILTWSSSRYWLPWTWERKIRLGNCKEQIQKLCIWILKIIVGMIQKNWTTSILFVTTKYIPGGSDSPAVSSPSVSLPSYCRENSHSSSPKILKKKGYNATDWFTEP